MDYDAGTCLTKKATKALTQGGNCANHGQPVFLSIYLSSVIHQPISVSTWFVLCVSIDFTLAAFLAHHSRCTTMGFSLVYIVMYDIHFTGTSKPIESASAADSMPSVKWSEEYIHHFQIWIAAIRHEVYYAVYTFFFASNRHSFISYFVHVTPFMFHFTQTVRFCLNCNNVWGLRC